MSAGFKYNITPEPSIEERYDVETGRRRRGPYKLDTTNLPVGEHLPVFTPIAADLVKKTAQVAIRVEVAEKYESGTTLKVKKRSLAYAGMNIGDGAHGAVVNSINKQNADYDELTLSAAIGGTLEVGAVLYEATDVSGTTPKVIANSALYDRTKIEEGIVLVTLLMRAFEIEPTKLVMPFSDIDKANMPHFQFNAPDVKQTSKGTVYTDATQSASGLMSAADKKKLDGIAANANKYTLPVASSSALGGIQLGFAQTGKKYPVAVEGNKAYVEVPWTDNNTTYNAASASTLGLVKQGAAVADAGPDDIQAKLNALLASLRTAGVIAKS
jgi:hypothetical protein